MIEVSHLTKVYGDKRGVSDISFTINEGEIVGFLGPNGAGKTTTMNIITGDLSATSGTARVAGIDVLQDPITAKKQIGYLPEHPPLYLDMKVSEYLNFVYELKNANLPDRKKHISDICELVGIEEVYQRVIKNLSKGYRQRVGLAQALIGNPNVLILDEPTVGLDPRQIVEIRNVIKELGKRRTVILSTHILPEVEAICERVLVINKGVIIADDEPQNLAGKVSGEHKLAVRISGPKERGAAAEDHRRDPRCHPLADRRRSKRFPCGVAPAIDIRKPMFNTLAKAGYPILMMRPHDMSLEDIFISLTEESADPDDLKVH